MNDRIHALLQQIHALQTELRALLATQEAKVQYRIKGHRVEFERVVRDTHLRLKMGLLRWLCASQWRNVLSAPLIYSMILPMFALDLCLSLYQAVCFRLYRIPRVRRSDYIVIDRQHLAYLNIIEKLNCLYCGYGNGLLAYAREITARTEQYWCPIKHARTVSGTHERYPGFLEYGDATELHARFAQFREALRQEE